MLSQILQGASCIRRKSKALFVSGVTTTTNALCGEGQNLQKASVSKIAAEGDQSPNIKDSLIDASGSPGLQLPSALPSVAS